jgi:uncharacterized membrane protein
MTWHYAAGGVQHGPVDEATFDRLVASGDVTPDTLVWRAGMPGWVPLREAPPFQAPGAPAAPTGAITALQALPQPTIDPDAAYERIVAEGRQVRVFDSLRRGWDLVFAQPGESIGISALVILTIVGAGLLPCVGSIAQIIATGPLLGGWQLYFLKRMRGQTTDWGDAWAGFQSPMVVQLVIQYGVQTAATLLAMAPVVAAFVVVFFSTIAAAAADDRLTLLTPLAFLGLGGVLLLAVAATLYLAIAWMFALPLIIDRQLPFWPAMKLSWRVAHRRFLPLLGLLLCCAVVNLVGLLALCVGIVVALPIGMAALAFTYEDLFGERAQA